MPSRNEAGTRKGEAGVLLHPPCLPRTERAWWVGVRRPAKGPRVFPLASSQGTGHRPGAWHGHGVVPGKRDVIKRSHDVVSSAREDGAGAWPLLAREWPGKALRGRGVGWVG